MTVTARLKSLEKTATAAAAPRTLAAIKKDRAAVLTMAKVTPDKWQRELLRAAPKRGLALCSRQSGKSTGAAADCVATALSEANALVLITSPTLRQSQELFRKCVGLWRSLGKPVAAETVSKTSLELVNGSRIVACPGDPDGLVGFSAPRLIVIDEASRAADELYYSVRPMLAMGGRLLCVSTPFGCRGWFHREYTEGGPGWRRFQVRADEVSRISPAFLEDERRALGPKWFAQEYLCSFENNAGAVFDYADILAAAREPEWLSAAVKGGPMRPDDFDPSEPRGVCSRPVPGVLQVLRADDRGHLWRWYSPGWVRCTTVGKYLRVRDEAGRKVTVPRAALVAAAWHGVKPPGWTVRFRDNDPTNCSPGIWRGRRRGRPRTSGRKWSA
jgi:hypothetical protein